MNSENIKTSDPHTILCNLSDKINLKRTNKYVALSNLSIYYTWKNIKKLYKNNKFEISAPTWNKKIQVPDGSYSVSDIQDYFEYIIKKHGEVTDNPPVRIYINEIGLYVKLKRYYLKLAMPNLIKLLGSIKSKITKNENGENLPHLETTEVVVVHCTIVKNDYQHDSRVLYIFVPTKSFGPSVDNSPKNFSFLKTFNS